MKVVDSSSGAPIPGASVVAQFLDTSTMKFYTDSQGIATVVGVPGSYKIFAFKTDFKPVQGDAQISINQTVNVILKLQRGKWIDGELTVRRMTLEEIKEAGIDVTAPENQWVYKYEIHLAFTQPPPIIINGEGQLISEAKPFVILGNGSGSSILILLSHTRRLLYTHLILRFHQRFAIW